eukprot:gene1723-19229_t
MHPPSVPAQALHPVPVTPFTPITAEPVTCSVTMEVFGAPTETVLGCPVGGTIAKVAFASYGTPTGDCSTGRFAASQCDAPGTTAVAEAACVGKNRCALSV